ncbi:MAG: UDP-N-acetylmuramoyl-L-alanine--D-glutamate ligase [Acidobacteria bacterium]|nr:UDP-N-acetylmuramoyl-L-alanine--D-glutamate ligase [Acidobacteriota bacterium]
MDSGRYDLRGKRVTVVGLARTGMAAVRFLLARGAQVTATDLRTAVELQEQVAALRPLGVQLDLGRHTDEVMLSADLILLSPGVPLSLAPLEKALAKGVPALSEVELASRFLRGRIVGITGSNGKTTVTTLIHEMLAGAGLFSQIGGNIGTPLIGLVETSREDGFTVAELSSFQLETTRHFHAHIAVVTNISPDHLDRHGSMGAYVAAKQRILNNQDSRDWAVLNADSAAAADLAALTAARVLLFSRLREPDEGVFVRDGEIHSRIGGQVRRQMSVSDIRLRGAHNLENVLAGLAAGLAAGAGSDCLAEAVRSFKGVEHRLEWVARIDGVDYYNDSKATNVDAVIKALGAFSSGIVLIAGGKDKGGDFAPLRPLVEDRVRRLIVIGAASEKIAEAMAGAVRIERAADMPEAVGRAREAAEPGDIVLLAPACASFDMYENFEHRGRVFKSAVRAIEEASRSGRN